MNFRSAQQAREMRPHIQGNSPFIRELRAQIASVAPYDVTVLIQGETGVGKELVAKEIHQLSGRSSGPFMAINCSALHQGLFENELFGHEAGAYTDARYATQGLLCAAAGGTVLLDEIGNMGLSLQSKLLRALEEREVMAVGATRATPIDVRIVAASNCDLGSAVQQGSFRADLYYRLDVVRLRVPPLSERREDVPLLAETILGEICGLLRMPTKALSPKVLDVLTSYDWPGNVRELGNALQHACVMGNGSTIDVEHLPEGVRAGAATRPCQFPSIQQVVYGHALQALQFCGGVKTRAANVLGVDPKTLRRILEGNGEPVERETT